MTLEADGFCTFDWTVYSPEEAKAFPQQMIDAAFSADVVVLIWRDYLLGALLECGAALAGNQTVYIVGLPGASLFWELPNVRVVADEDALLSRLNSPSWAEVSDFLAGK